MFKVDIINKKLIRLEPTNFAALNLRERFDIQEWIEKTPDILGEDLLVIGKEFILSSGRRLDLLCVDKQGELVIVELKRDDSGAAVEWQAIKYASYISSLSDDEVFQQYATYGGCDISQARKEIEEFIEVDIADINHSQRIILVSREFNSEVISAVFWLREFGVNIQCTRLAPYLDGTELFIKPEILIPLPEAKDFIERKEQKLRDVTAPRAEWSGEWYVNVGEGDSRTWEDNVQFGYIGAGGKRRFSDALKQLTPGSKIFAYMKGLGYVGYGEVMGEAKPIRDAMFEGRPLLDAKLRAVNAGKDLHDDDLCEYVVAVDWIKTVTSSQAKYFKGVFANQNVVCKLRHEPTLKFVNEHFVET